MSTQEPPIDYTKIYSPYKLSMFRQCPQEYHFSYLSPIYSKLKYDLQRLPQNIWSFYTIGKAVHDAITLFYHLYPEDRNEPNLLAGLKETWRSEAMRQKKPPLGKWGGFDEDDLESERAAYRRSQQILRNFLGLADIEPNIRFLPTHDFKNSIEDYKALITPLTNGIDISGKFDLVIDLPDGTLQVIDYKTSKNSKPDPLQLHFYKALAELHFRQPVSQVSNYFLESGEVKNGGLQNESTDEIKDDLLKRIEDIRNTNDFKPNPSELCRYCLFKTFCPAKEEVKEVLQKPGGEYETPSDLPF